MERAYMKITFENSTAAQLNSERQGFKTLETKEAPQNNAGFSIGSSLNKNTSYQTGNKSVTDFRNEFSARNVSAEQDEMTVLSNTLSGEQYAAYLKDGNIRDVDLSDAENIVDHIKLELIKGGTEIKGYTDDLPPELEKEVKEAIDKASEITELNDGMKRALVAEGCPLTIDNLYLAKFTQSEALSSESGNYFTMETPGYYGEKAVIADEATLRTQVAELLGTTDEAKIDEGVWLVKNSFEINDTNITRLENVLSLSLPMNHDRIERAIDIALVEGRKPMEADLTKTESIYEEAVRITDEILKLSDREVHARRVLEEVRLMMTTETNLKLIKSGIAIDTEDLETYVEALKKVENSREFKESVEISRVNETIKEVKELPAAVIGHMMEIPEIDTLVKIRDEGEVLKARLEKAGEEYEKLFTEVRYDLGDSIKKAFRNVDAMLEEGGFEVNDANRRAVRILGYNTMDINEENLDKVKVLDEKLNHIIKSLTPADTLKLIRQGKSPADMSIEELNEYIEEKRTGDDEKMEKYSKFLYKLERADGINEEERKQYIEVYRLLHHLEKTGYAAIGSLVKTGRELSFANLKEEIRSSKHVGMDVKVDESFGLLVRNLIDDLEPVKMKAAGIIEETNLNEAYESMKNESGDARAERQYNAEALKEIREGLEVSEGAVKEIINRGEPVTISGLLATESLMKNRGRAFKKVEELRGEDFRKEAADVVDNSGDKEKISTEYNEMIDNSKSSVTDAAMMSESYLDVRELMLTHKELSVAASMAKGETYNVPMEVAGELTNVCVKIVHNEKEEPGVKVSLETEELGSVSASLTGTLENISGYIACNLKEAVTKMEKAADILGKNVAVVFSPEKDNRGFHEISMKDNSERVSSAELYQMAHRFLKAIQGE